MYLHAHGAGSDMWRASTTPCANANSRKSPMPPHTLKFTQVSVEKWNATYQFATAIAAKKPTHDHVSRVQTADGSTRSFSNTAMRSRWKTTLPAASVMPNIPYNTVGFHLMNVSSWSNNVAPPKIAMIAKESQWTAEILRRQPKYSSCTTDAAIATA